MKPKVRMAIFALIFLALLIPSSVLAAPIGKISAVQGNVDVTVGSTPAVAAREGMPVNEGDILRAKSKSKAEVTFNDGNQLRLAANTRLKITAYAVGEKKSNFLNLFRGKMQSMVKNLGKGSTYEVRTPTAVCGVRGTDFFTFFQNGVSGAIFKEGTGYGYNSNMPNDVKVITAGQAMVISTKDAPPVIKPATAADIEKHLKDTAPPPKKDEEKKEEGKKDDQGGQQAKQEEKKEEGKKDDQGGQGEQQGQQQGQQEGGTQQGQQEGQQGSGTQQASGPPPEGQETAPPPPSAPVVSQLMEPPPSAPAPPVITTEAPPVDIATQVQQQESAEIIIEEQSTPEPEPEPTPTPEPTPEPTPPPVVPKTTFSTATTLGALSGTLSGEIVDATNVGTASLSGAYANPLAPTTSMVSGALSDGSTYDAALAGMPGSYRALMRGIYRKGDSIGYLRGNLSGTATGGTLSTTGAVERTGILGTVANSSDVISVITDISVPQIADLFPAAAVESPSLADVRGFYTAASYGMQGVEAVWSTTTTGGNYSSSSTAMYGAYGFMDSADPYYYGSPYYMMGDDLIAAADPATGRVNMSGNLLYLDSNYMGIIGLAYQGKYDPASPAGTYESVGAGTASMAPLAFFGEWGPYMGGPGCLFSNVTGNYTWAGSDSGIFGGLDPFWSGSGSPFLAMGTNDFDPYYAGKSHYLWNTEIYGRQNEVFSGEYMAQMRGYTAGLWVPGATTVNGAARAVYVDLAGTPGILFSDDITMSSYPAIGMWKAEGTLTPYPSGDPGGVYYYPHLGTLSGRFGGAFGAGAIFGASSEAYSFSETTFLMNEVSGQSLNWGIYNLRLGAGNTFSGKPTGDASWSAMVGGTGDFGYSYDNGYENGYWLMQAIGTWYSTGEASGAASGFYMTNKWIGNIGGPVTAVGEDGNWIGQSIGSYSAGTAVTYPGYWGSSDFLNSLYANYYSEGSTPIKAGDDWGMAGITSTPWNTLGNNFLAIGDYDVSMYGYGGQSSYVMNTEVGSREMQFFPGDSINAGEFIGQGAGLWKFGEIEGALSALYVAPDGLSSGIFTAYNPLSTAPAGTLVGNYYGMDATGDVGLWFLQGTLTQTQKADSRYSAFTLQSDPSNLVAAFISGDDSVSGNGMSTRYYFNAYDSVLGRNYDLPWGIYQFSVDQGTFNLTAEKTPETYLTGRDLPVGSGSDVTQESFWIGDLKNMAWANGQIHGTLSGQYLSRTQMGTMKEGPFYGLYSIDSTGGWIGAGVGVFQGEPLALSADVGGGYGGFGYYNGTGFSWSNTNDLAGRLGVTTAMWNAGSSSGPQAFLSIGSANNAGGYPSYQPYPLWKSTLTGNTTDNATESAGGPYAFAGYMGGLVMNYDAVNGIANSDTVGTAAAIYVRPDGAGGYVAGFMTSKDIVPNFYEDLNMYKATGTLTAVDMAATTLTPDDLYWGSGYLSEGNLTKLHITGAVTGSIYAKPLHLVESSQTLPWGVMSAEAGGVYEGTWPSGSSWTSNLGASVGTGYILGHAAGLSIAGGNFFRTDATFDEIHLSADIFSLTAASYTVSYADTAAASSVMLFGSYGNNTWQAYGTGVGGMLQNLAFAGRVENGAYGIFGNGSLVFSDTAAYPLTTPRGILGGTSALLESGSVALSGIGSYYSAADNPLLKMGIQGYDLANAGSAYGGAYLEMSMGGVRNATTAYGRIVGLYAKRVAAAYDLGTVSSNFFTANLYPDLNPLGPADPNYQAGTGMWQIANGATLSASASLGAVESTPTISSLDITGRIGSGTSGAVTGRVTSFSGQDWGVMSANMGGNIGSSPDTIAGGAVLHNEQTVGYWLANISHDPPVSGLFQGTVFNGNILQLTDGAGAFASVFSGDVFGLFDYGAGKFHGAAAGQFGPDPYTSLDHGALSFAAKSEGNLYSLQDGALVSRTYYRPYYRQYGGFHPLSYEQAYINLANVTDSTNGWSFERIDDVPYPGSPSDYQQTFEISYNDENRYVVAKRADGFSGIVGKGWTSLLYPTPDFSADPPVSYFADMSRVVNNAAPGDTQFNYDQYILAMADSNWMVRGLYTPNGLVRNDNAVFNAILGGYGDLWTTSPASPADVYAIGEHGTYSGPQIFRSKFEMSASASGGSFMGRLTGIILGDNTYTDYAENTLDGLAVGLYVNGAKAGILKGRTTFGASYPEIGMWEADLDMWVEERSTTNTIGAADFLLTGC